ncbi:unnamed protein product [Chrysoparadoxa australica]
MLPADVELYFPPNIYPSYTSFLKQCPGPNHHTHLSPSPLEEHQVDDKNDTEGNPEFSGVVHAQGLQGKAKDMSRGFEVGQGGDSGLTVSMLLGVKACGSTWPSS